MEFKQALCLLIEAGCDVVHSDGGHSVHVCRSKSGDYELLYFDHKGDLKENRTENFADINDAVGKFMRRMDKEAA